MGSAGVTFPSLGIVTLRTWDRKCLNCVVDKIHQDIQNLDAFTAKSTGDANPMVPTGTLNECAKKYLETTLAELLSYKAYIEYVKSDWFPNRLDSESGRPNGFNQFICKHLHTMMEVEMKREEDKERWAQMSAILSDMWDLLVDPVATAARVKTAEAKAKVDAEAKAKAARWQRNTQYLGREYIR